MVKLNAPSRIWKVRVKEPAYRGDTRMSPREHIYTRRMDAVNRANGAVAKGGEVLDFAIGEINWMVDQDWLDSQGAQMLLDKLPKKEEI